MKNLQSQQANGGVNNTGDLSLANANANILAKQQQSQGKKTLNITVLHKNKVKNDLKEDEKLFMQQIAKINKSTVAGRTSTATNGSAAPSNTE